MLDALASLASVGDALRLLAVPLLGWAALRDVRTRRVPNWVWYVLGGLGVVLLIADLAVWFPFNTYIRTLSLIQVAISVFFVLPLCFLFYLAKGFGGADFKALAALCVLFPTYPIYYSPLFLVEMGVPPVLPATYTQIGVFSLTILTNTVVVGIVLPLGLAVRNALSGRFGVPMFLGTTVKTSELPNLHGRLFADQRRYSLSNLSIGKISNKFNLDHISGESVKSLFTPHGFDLDALRMYLRWRGLSLVELRANPARYRDPESVGETFVATDGAVDEDAAEHGLAGGVDAADIAKNADSEERTADFDDPWAAERFLDEIEGSAYGTDAETLREGLETVAEAEDVWLSPGLPFIVPMFVGLVIALTYGDLLYGLLTGLGLA